MEALGSVRLQKLSIRKNYKELTSGQAMIEAGFAPTAFAPVAPVASAAASSSTGSDRLQALQEFHVAAFASMTEFAFFGDRNDSILWHDTRLPEVLGIGTPGRRSGDGHGSFDVWWHSGDVMSEIGRSLRRS